MLSAAKRYLVRSSPARVFAALLATILLSAGGSWPGRERFTTPSARRQLLPQAVARAMRGRSGTAVVLDVATGKLLASYHLEVAARRLVPPGSTVKPFTLMALIETGKLPPAPRLLCPRRLVLAGRQLDCTHPVSGEAFDARAALAWSCNNWFAQMAARLEPHELRTAFERAGLASPTGLAREEAVGSVREASRDTDLPLLAIGLSNIEVTPLGLAAAYRRLVLRRRDPAGEQKFAPIFGGLEDSVAFGMASAAQASPDWPGAGKTGTATTRGGEGWTHAWFAGYWPADLPEIVVVVFLERGRGGGDAAPLARAIVAYSLDSGRHP